jgi:hypothetical protein
MRLRVVADYSKKAGGFTPWTPDRRAAGVASAARHKALVPRSACDAGGTPVRGRGGETPRLSWLP